MHKNDNRLLMHHDDKPITNRNIERIVIIEISEQLNPLETKRFHVQIQFNIGAVAIFKFKYYSNANRMWRKLRGIDVRE